MNLLLKSLRAIKDLNYPNYDFIPVNSSFADDSLNALKKFITKNAPLRMEIITGGKNLTLFIKLGKVRK